MGESIPIFDGKYSGETLVDKVGTLKFCKLVLVCKRLCKPS